MERAEELIERLENRLVHTQGEPDAKVEKRGETEKWEQRASSADRESGSEFFGRDALCELGEDGVTEAAAPEAGCRSSGHAVERERALSK